MGERRFFFPLPAASKAKSEDGRNGRGAQVPGVWLFFPRADHPTVLAQHLPGLRSEHLGANAGRGVSTGRPRLRLSAVRL